MLFKSILSLGLVAVVVSVQPQEDERCCKALGGQCVPSSQCRISLFPGAICPDNEVCCRQEINPEDCRHGNGECLPPDVCKEKGGFNNLIPCPGDEVCCGDGKESTRECLASEGQCVQEETCKDNGGSPSGVPCPGDLVCCKCKGDDPIGTDDCKKSGGTCVDPDDCRKSSGSDNGVPCPDNLVCCEKKDDCECDCIDRKFCNSWITWTYKNPCNSRTDVCCLEPKAFIIDAFKG